eukprot:s1452_g3.t1
MEVWSENVAQDLTDSARPLQTEWQENFQKPEPSTAPAALRGGVAAWDQVLNKELLRQLDACVDDHFQYIFTHRRVFGADEGFPGSAANMWLPSEKAPRSAPEVAAMGILQHVLQGDAEEFSGVEYWARVRSFNLGAAFHYDTAVDAKDVHGDWIHGNPWRPQWSCVLYLSDGGPTLVLDQIHCDTGSVDPVLPAAGHLCMARRNRLLIFRADLFHGSLPEKIWLDTDMSRKVFIFNFWRRHVPEPPSCQPPQLARHVAMQRHRLKDQEVATLQAQLEDHFAQRLRWLARALFRTPWTFSSMASASSTPLSDVSTRDSFIPLFTGQPADYKEWRKRIHIYHRKMTIAKRTGESLLNIIGSMQGTAWRLLEDFDLETVEKPESFQAIIKILDAHFEYDSRVQLPADFDGYFNLQRKQGQTLLSYVSDHAEMHRKLEKHGVSLPTAVQGWHLLRQCGLTKEQKQLVTLRAPSLELTKVVEALYLILGQDYKQSVHGHGDRRWHRGKGGRGHVAEEEDYEDWEYAEEGYWGYEDEFYDQDYEDPGDFESEYGYFHDEHDLPENEQATESFDVEAYDEAFAAYLDARKRFSDLRLARGYLPVVALTDPAAGNLSPGTTSPTRSSGGGSPKGKSKGKSSKGGGKAKGKGKSDKPNIYRYDKPPEKAAQPRQRAAAALQCLRCGQPGHFAANCPIKSTNKKRPATESMARHDEGALVTFTDKDGTERLDVALLDPGASAFLCGYGPMVRYIKHLEQLGFPIKQILFYQCDRKFHFGGDAASMAHWVVRMPMFVNGRFGYAQVFLVPGETPMLCGRPIIQQLGISLDFSTERIRYGDGLWTPSLMGIHGEYLLPLCADFEIYHDTLEPHFDLQLATPGEVDMNPWSFDEFNNKETIFTANEEPEPVTPGTLKCQRHLLNTLDTKLVEEIGKHHSYLTSELHQPPQGRTIWEVYAGKGRLSQVAESMGGIVTTFSLKLGGISTKLGIDKLSWTCRKPSALMKFSSHQRVAPGPTCSTWLRELKSNVNNLLNIENGIMPHISSSTGRFISNKFNKALFDLPGYRAQFDQCQYGAEWEDVDLVWRPVKKSTAIQTTKRALWQEFQKICDGSHRHCRLEGSSPATGRRTKFMENYQPTLAGILAACLMADETPIAWEFIGAADDEKEQLGHLVKLMTENRQEAVRTVQRLHRGLGHPSPEALTELLESRGASETILKCAREYKCVACARYKKPDGIAPSSLPKAKEFNERLQADVLWFKIDKHKIPALSLVDEATKYQAAAVIHSERAEHFQQAIERLWIRNFGCPKVLITDEGRGWNADRFNEWTSDQMIEHVVAPGEAHTRLALVERRHAVLRKAAEVWMDDQKMVTVEGLKQALCYVVPQLNASPTVCGFSPSQWLYGFQPRFGGELLGDSLGPAQLQGNQSFEESLQKRAVAKQAITKAETDRKLRRALLRRYRNQHDSLAVGQSCHFWRDAKATDLMKVRWHGPARVLMVEFNEEGQPKLYWLGFKTQLIRAAPHHVRPNFENISADIDGLEAARRDINGLKSIEE